MNLSIIDILFIVTVVLFVFNGFRNGAVFSLINFISLPLGLAAAYYYGPSFTGLLASSGISATPLIAYVVLFLGVVFLIHILGNMIRGIVKSIPLISQGDTLIGGALGFVEAWVLWLLLLIVLGSFLADVQSSTGLAASLNVHADQLRSWHDFYNQAVNNSLFARVNGFFVKTLPGIPALSTTH
jgi:Uncharacterized membrane protein, required for colicin V production